MAAELLEFEPPTKGWNSRDNSDAMPPGYAEEMVNMVPENGFARSRGGTQTYQLESVANSGIGATGPVETLEVFNHNGSEVLVAARGEFVYTIDDESTATELGDGFINARWQVMNFNNRLVMVNGADAPQEFDGTTLSAITMNLNDSTGTSLGLSNSVLIGCMIFKGRAIYWEDNAKRFFYCDTAGGYAGDVRAFPIEIITKKGGKIVSIMSYGRDSGSGLDDYLVIHMSTGEAIVYAGQDPGTDFQIVQTYNIGAPVSIRGNAPFGGDQVVATYDGIQNLSTALPNQGYSKAGNAGDAIVPDARKAAKKYGSNYGWEIEFFPRFGWLIVNVPRSSTAFDQYVLNTVTNGWFKIRNIPAITWTVWDGRLMYGDPDGNIVEAEVGAYDERNGIPETIPWKIITAFTTMGKSSRTKTVVEAAVTHNWAYGQNIDIDVLTNYQRQSSYPISDPAEPIPGVWGTAIWGESSWGGVGEPLEGYTRRDVFAASGSGTAVALKIRGQSKATTITLYSLALKVKDGGIA